MVAKLAGRERLEPVGDEEAHSAFEAAARDLEAGHLPEAELGGDEVPDKSVGKLRRLRTLPRPPSLEREGVLL